PFECGCLLAREPRKLEEAFSVHPEYLTDVRARDQHVNFAAHAEQLRRSPRARRRDLARPGRAAEALVARVETLALSAVLRRLTDARGDRPRDSPSRIRGTAVRRGSRFRESRDR